MCVCVGGGVKRGMEVTDQTAGSRQFLMDIDAAMPTRHSQFDYSPSTSLQEVRYSKEDGREHSR